MESQIDKGLMVAAMKNLDVPTEAAELYAAANRIQAGIVVALMEFRETVEDGLTRIDQTSVEAAMMLVGVKESFDGYIQRRLETDKVIEGLTTAIREQREQIEEKAEPKVDEPKKAAVTLEVGNFGGPMSEAGIA